jgi:hypothetical protein
MIGAIPPLSQYAFMAWCSVKAQGQLYLYLTVFFLLKDIKLQIGLRLIVHPPKSVDSVNVT